MGRESCLRRGVPARLALSGALGEPLGEQALEGAKVGAGIGAQVERLRLVAKPDSHRGPALLGLAFLDREMAHRAIGIGAGLDPRLEQMLALGEQDPPIGEEDDARRSDEGGVDHLLRDQMGGEAGRFGGGRLVDVENAHRR
jgi:hypothetical protein